MKYLEIHKRSVESLVLQYQNNKDNAAFGELYRRYYVNLFQFCKRILLNREDAYDIATNAFVRAADRIQQLSSPELFPNWLYRIAHNMCLDAVKSKKKNRVIEFKDKFNTVDSQTDIDEKMEIESKYLKLDLLFEKLNKKEKEILIEKYYNEKSIADLQIQFKLSASAVKMRLARARQKIALLA